MSRREGVCPNQPIPAPWDEIIARVLDPETIRLRSGARFADLRWSHYEDWAGFPSLKVRVLFTESALRRVRYDRIAPIVEAIRSGLCAAGIDLHAYIRIDRVRTR